MKQIFFAFTLLFAFQLTANSQYLMVLAEKMRLERRDSTLTRKKLSKIQEQLSKEAKNAAPKFGGEFEGPRKDKEARQREEAKKYIERRKSADKFPSLENIDFLFIEELGFSENTMGPREGLISVFNETESKPYKISANIYLKDLMEINLRLNKINSESIDNNVFATVYSGVNEDNDAKVRVELILHTEKTGGLMTIQHNGRSPIYLIVKYAKY